MPKKKGTLLKTLIDRARRRECQADVVLVLDDPGALRMVMSWPNLAKLVPGEGARYEEIDDAWKDVAYDERTWAKMADVAWETVTELEPVLRGNLLIYPDGSIHRQVKIHCQRKVKVATQSKSYRKPKD